MQPDIKVSLKQTFGFDSKMEVEAFSKKSEHVPEIDKNYKFDKDTTCLLYTANLILLLSVQYVLIYLFHGNLELKLFY